MGSWESNVFFSFLRLVLLLLTLVWVSLSANDDAFTVFCPQHTHPRYPKPDSCYLSDQFELKINVSFSIQVTWTLIWFHQQAFADGLVQWTGPHASDQGCLIVTTRKFFRVLAQHFNDKEGFCDVANTQEFGTLVSEMSTMNDTVTLPFFLGKPRHFSLAWETPPSLEYDPTSEARNFIPPFLSLETVWVDHRHQNSTSPFFVPSCLGERIGVVSRLDFLRERQGEDYNLRADYLEGRWDLQNHIFHGCMDFSESRQGRNVFIILFSTLFGIPCGSAILCVLCFLFGQYLPDRWDSCCTKRRLAREQKHAQELQWRREAVISFFGTEDLQSSKSINEPPSLLFLTASFLVERRPDLLLNAPLPHPLRQHIQYLMDLKSPPPHFSSSSPQPSRCCCSVLVRPIAPPSDEETLLLLA